MSKKKESKISIQAKRRLFFMRPICFFLVFFLIVTLLSNMVKLYKLNNEKKEKESAYIEAQERTEYLKTEVAKLNDPEYLAKFARENYSYSKEGELIIRVDNSSNKKEEVKVEDNVVNTKNNKKLYLSIGISIFIFYITLVIIRRKKVSYD